MAETYKIDDLEFELVGFGEMTLQQANEVQRVIDEALPLLDFEEGMRLQEVLGQVFSEGRIAARLTAGVLRPVDGKWAVPDDDFIQAVEASLTVNQVKEILTGFFLPAVELLTASQISSGVLDKLEALRGQVSGNPGIRESGNGNGGSGESASPSQSAGETQGDTGKS